ncbi:LppA family lipoprotein [Nocardia sp. XZ_19_369]|uniref:LppA family lipoprotein n=1 Tax=Nocardia sp. XZ_19_369 TaxID=2769487 RepID=UPI00188E6AAE|nr:LppA family lipoprotein [Nocardia sp. XZ_19_369]
MNEPDRPAPKQDIAHAEAKMRTWPSVEATERQLAALLRQIADAAKTVAPGLDWRTIPDRGQRTLGCPSPYLETDGVSMTTDTLTSLVPITDSEWPGVLRIARDIAAKDGITALTVRTDIPGRHDVTLHSPDHGNEITLGTAQAALLTGLTGCRYRDEDLRKQPGN